MINLIQEIPPLVPPEQDDDDKSFISIDPHGDGCLDCAEPLEVSSSFSDSSDMAVKAFYKQCDTACKCCGDKHGKDAFCDCGGKHLEGFPP